MVAKVVLRLLRFSVKSKFTVVKIRKHIPSEFDRLRSYESY